MLLLLYAGNTARGQDGPTRLFRQWDRNNDGYLTIQEVPVRARRSFSSIDTNKDGKITLQEHRTAALQRPPNKSGNTPQRSAPSAWPRTQIKTLKVRQQWHQEPLGYDRLAYLSIPPKGGTQRPVVIFFHGNGGDASRSLNRWRSLSSCILVAPQGYQKSWNVSGERSQAPDVQYVRELIAMIGIECPRADMQNVTLIGSSNGSALIQRLMIECDEKLFQSAILLSASLVTEQYRDGSFWMPSETTKNYDKQKKPTPGVQVVYFHGTDDRVVPYRGGLRGGQHKHLSAQHTTHLWARAFGFQGKQLDDSAGTVIEKGIVAYRYPLANVVHYKLIGAGHGAQPYETQVQSIIKRTIDR